MAIQDLRYLQGDLALLKAKADAIYQASATVVYLGFAARGVTALSDAAWSICKIEQDNTTPPYTLTKKWANGQNQPILQFSKMENYTYKFKNF